MRTSRVEYKFPSLQLGVGATGKVSVRTAEGFLFLPSTLKIPDGIASVVGVSIGGKNQFAGWLTNDFSGLGHDVSHFDPCAPGESIEIELKFFREAVWSGTIYGRSVAFPW